MADLASHLKTMSQRLSSMDMRGAFRSSAYAKSMGVNLAGAADPGTPQRGGSMADRPEIEKARLEAERIVRVAPNGRSGIVARAFLDLLGKQSDRDADTYLLVSWVRSRLVSSLPSALSEAADRLYARLAPLPEQSEEEDRDERWIHSPDREVADAD